MTYYIVAFAYHKQQNYATLNMYWENFHGFCGFLANRKSFTLESFAVYSTRWPRSDALQKFSSE